MRMNTGMQRKLSISKVGVPARQWSLPYIVSSGLTAASIYASNFGDALNRGSPAWVSLSCQSLDEHLF